ncbi:hypothetical protein AJ78_07814 [Emergomyces pasteurianus Ep9510]|uniref:FAD-binding PCMH-type domain-containing protein n=1 Tax=Emergomyces pasteurianus Ep9510 TaxID=1447872 RepID=A0A1J9P6A5_9EURO|nr:hypothetical protein AJ78_07814 [Emergomyces pasteurianus Ep9510]
MAGIIARLSLLLSLTRLCLASVFAQPMCYPGDVCSMIGRRYPRTVYHPGSEKYKYENENYYSTTTISKPMCIFAPRSTYEVAGAVEILAASDVKFTVRGGGHMPIPGYGNVDGGVLIVFTSMKQLQLSRDKSFVSVGPGNRWAEVYEYLEPHGLVALGGRLGSVGVPGFLLGGGISFYSNQYGFAANNVVAYEVVLSGGEIVAATATEHSDLFWALKGGGNSFGIVTRFDLATFHSPKICGGVLVHDAAPRDQFFNAVVRFAQDGSKDAKAAIIPAITLIPSHSMELHVSFIFYDGEECDQPALADFTAIPSKSNTYRQTTLAKFAAEQDGFIPHPRRRSFGVVSSLGTAEAIRIVHDIFVNSAKDELSDIPEITTSLSFQPVTKRFIEEGARKGGNPQGLDASKAPYFWIVQIITWTHAKYDQRIAEYRKSTVVKMEDALDAAGQRADFRYLNDADKGQQVFENYGGDNLAKLKQIRAKYDPTLLYTNSLTGGWKVENAQG